MPISNATLSHPQNITKNNHSSVFSFHICRRHSQLHFKFLHSSLNPQYQLQRLQLSILQTRYLLVNFLRLYPRVLYLSLHLIFILFQLSNQSLLVLLRLLIQVPFDVQLCLLYALLYVIITSCSSVKCNNRRWIYYKLVPKASIRAGKFSLEILEDVLSPDWPSDEKVVVIQ